MLRNLLESFREDRVTFREALFMLEEGTHEEFVNLYRKIKNIKGATPDVTALRRNQELRKLHLKRAKAISAEREGLAAAKKAAKDQAIKAGTDPKAAAKSASKTIRVGKKDVPLEKHLEKKLKMKKQFAGERGVFGSKGFGPAARHSFHQVTKGTSPGKTVLGKAIGKKVTKTSGDVVNYFLGGKKGKKPSDGGGLGWKSALALTGAGSVAGAAGAAHFARKKINRELPWIVGGSAATGALASRLLDKDK